MADPGSTDGVVSMLPHDVFDAVLTTVYVHGAREHALAASSSCRAARALWCSRGVQAGRLARVLGADAADGGCCVHRWAPEVPLVAQAVARLPSPSLPFALLLDFDVRPEDNGDDVPRDYHQLVDAMQRSSMLTRVSDGLKTLGHACTDAWVRIDLSVGASAHTIEWAKCCMNAGCPS
jgi:hypothetical protein